MRNLFIRMVVMLVVMFSTSVTAKTYEVKMTPCEIKSQCKSCREVIKVSYEVSDINKSVDAVSYLNGQQAIRETLNGCKVKDSLNWSCSLPTISIQVRGGEVSITTNTKSSLFASHHEMCLIN